jgi:hypothetical protein
MNKRGSTKEYSKQLEENQHTAKNKFLHLIFQLKNKDWLYGFKKKAHKKLTSQVKS